MSHHHNLDELNIANIPDDALRKLQDAEKNINQNRDTTKNGQIYLIALSR